MSGKFHHLGKITEVKVLGRGSHTNTEKAQEKLIHSLLVAMKNLRGSPLIRQIWFPTWKAKAIVSTDHDTVDRNLVDSITLQMALNGSQRNVVRSMVLDNEKRLVVAHGMPSSPPQVALANWFHAESQAHLGQVKRQRLQLHHASGTCGIALFGSWLIPMLQWRISRKPCTKNRLISCWSQTLSFKGVLRRVVYLSPHVNFQHLIITTS